LDADNFFDCFFDVELLNVFAEFTGFDLRIVEQVLDQKDHQVGGSLLGLQSFF
jgi:hypothetical protein